MSTSAATPPAALDRFAVSSATSFGPAAAAREGLAPAPEPPPSVVTPEASAKPTRQRRPLAMKMKQGHPSNGSTWDASTKRMFIEICVEEVAAKNRPTQCLNKQGYRNLMSKLKERTGRAYTRKQLKNHWDCLKLDYINWKTLKHKSSGLGVDPETGSIAASDEWWAEQSKALRNCGKFRKAPLQHEDMLGFIFEGVNCMNVLSVMPAAERSGVGRKSHSSNVTVSNASGLDNDPVRLEIEAMLGTVVNSGADEGSDEHFYATHLLIRKEYRDVFRTLRSPEVRLGWLRRTWEEVRPPKVDACIPYIDFN